LVANTNNLSIHRVNWYYRSKIKYYIKLSNSYSEEVQLLNFTSYTNKGEANTIFAPTKYHKSDTILVGAMYTDKETNIVYNKQIYFLIKE